MENQKKVPKRLISEEVQQRAQQQHLKDAENAEELAKKNHNFVQMNKSLIAPARALARRSPAAHQVMMLFVEKMNKQNAVACSQATLGKILDYSVPTIKRAVALLEKEKWVQVVKIGSSNAYVVNSTVFWQSSRIGKFAVFGATIIADIAEQNYTEEDWKDVKLKQFPIIMDNERLIVKDEKLDPPDQLEMEDLI